MMTTKKRSTLSKKTKESVSTNPYAFFVRLWNVLRTHAVDFAYWGNALIVASCVLFLVKGYLLVQTGATEQGSLGGNLQWLLGRRGNDSLYVFLIWLSAAAAMRIGNRRFKRFLLLIPLLLIAVYAADMFAIVNLHSRFLLAGVNFLSWDNAGPFLSAGLWALASLILLMYGSVLLSYALAKNRSRRRIDRLVIYGLFVVIGIFLASFSVPQDSSYQKNVIQLYYEGGKREQHHETASYESYFAPKKGTNKKPDIIVVFAESFSSIDSAAYGGTRSLLTGFDTIAKDGTLYTNFIANGCTSDTAHIAFLQGVEPWETPSLSQDYLRYKSFTLPLPAFLSQHGYSSTFVSTAPLGFLNQKPFLEAMQFDKIVDSAAFTHYPKYVFRAAADEAMYEKTENLILEGSTQPHFYMLESISSHKPYNAPGGATTEESAFAYSDAQLLSFYRKLQAMHYFDHGIMIVVGDHRKMQAMGYDEIQKRGNAAYGKAVMAVVGKDVPANITVDTPIQHRDMHYSLKRLVSDKPVVVNTKYNDMFTNYRGREAAIRYCQYVDRQYVATTADGTTWNVSPTQKSSLSDYVFAERAFQFGGVAQISGGDAGKDATGSQQFPGLVRAAHQGDTTVSPPNSLEAFYAAKKKGAEAVEMDISFTKDGFPIVMHGPDIGRTVCTKAGGKKNVSDFMLQEMKDTCKLFNGQVVLTLQEVIEKTQGQFRRYFVDIKMIDEQQKEFVPPMLQSLKKLGYADHIMFSSDQEDINYILGSTRDIVAGWEIYDEAALATAIDADNAFILLPEKLAKPGVVRDIIHARKIPIVFTINDPASMHNLYDWGVRYIITDDVEGVVK